MIEIKMNLYYMDKMKLKQKQKNQKMNMMNMMNMMNKYKF